MSTDAHTKPCPFCGSLVLFERSTNTVGHEYPECMGFKATLARFAGVADSTIIQVRDLETKEHLANVRIAHV